jgi:amino acid transporter
MAQDKGFYVRRASGLVREVSGMDVLFYNVFMIGLPVIMLLALNWIAYPGSDMVWSIVICIVGGLGMTTVYSLYSAVFPRSGAEYVYLTRSLPPVLGFLFSWNSVVFNTYFVGFTAALVSFSAVSPLLTCLGLVTGSESLIAAARWTESSMGILIIGTLVIVFYALLLIRGMKVYFTYQKVAFVIAILGFVVGIVVLAMTTQNAFALKFNHLMSNFTTVPDPYNSIIETAKANGYEWAPFSAWQTLRLSIWMYISLGYCVLSSSFAGEIKNVRRSQLVGMMGGVLLAGMIFIGWAFFGERALGGDFLRGITYLVFAAPQASIFPTLPWLSLFASIAADNIALGAIIFIGVFVGSLVLPGAEMVYVSRNILAWSIDRLTPDKLGVVDQRYHTPVNAIILVAVGGIIVNAIFAFAGQVPILLSILMWGEFAIAFTFGATCLVGMLFPYIKREFYKGSAAQIEIGGVPVMTIGGIVGTIFIGTMIYLYMTDDFIGANTPAAYSTIALSFIVGALFYYTLKWKRKKEGIDISLAYKEVPIE